MLLIVATIMPFSFHCCGLYSRSAHSLYLLPSSTGRKRSKYVCIALGVVPRVVQGCNYAFQLNAQCVLSCTALHDEGEREESSSEPSALGQQKCQRRFFSLFLAQCKIKRVVARNGWREGSIWQELTFP